jgi:hypothetical protein
MITAMYDVPFASIVWDGAPVAWEPFFAFAFVEEGADRVNPESLRFDWSVSVNGSLSDEGFHPSDGQAIREVDPDHRFTYTYDAGPDDSVSIAVGVEWNGVRQTSVTEFIVPRPPQPYPSWSWNTEGGIWVPPVPPPAPGYVWDEIVTDWVLADSG